MNWVHGQYVPGAFPHPVPVSRIVEFRAENQIASIEAGVPYKDEEIFQGQVIDWAGRKEDFQGIDTPVLGAIRERDRLAIPPNLFWLFLYMSKKALDRPKVLVSFPPNCCRSELNLKLFSNFLAFVKGVY
jgi:hypothetical protein